LKILKPLLLLLFLAALTLPSSSAVASPPAQQVLPPEGWQLCQDLGMVNIPGVGDRQLFQMCQGEGWEVQAYCLDPGMPVPQLGDTCSLLGGNTFWCGDGIQQLQLFQILETPVPSTSTPTPTPTLTPTLTPIPTLTPSPTATGQQPTPGPDTPVPTLPSRPTPGGPGNGNIFLILGSLAAGLILAGAAGLGKWLNLTNRAE
jgi:hypothetical protein